MAKAARGAVVEAVAAAVEGDDEDRDEHQRPDRAVDEVAVVAVEAVDDDDDEVESPAVRWAVAVALPRDVSGLRWGCCSCGRRRRSGRPPTSTMSRMKTSTMRRFDATCGA